MAAAAGVRRADDMIKTLKVWFVAVAIESAVWTVRTLSYVVCCVQPWTGPGRDVRATTAPGLLILASVLLSVCLNSLILLVVRTLPSSGSGPTAGGSVKSADLEYVGRMIVLGSILVAAPLVTIAAVQSVALPAPLLFLALFAPLAYAASEGILHALWPR